MLVNGGIVINHCTTTNLWNRRQIKFGMPPWQQKWSRRTQISVLRLLSTITSTSFAFISSCHLLNSHISSLFLCWFHVLAFDDDIIINLPWHRVTSNEDNRVLWKVIIVGCQVACVKHIYYYVLLFWGPCLLTTFSTTSERCSMVYT